MKTIELLEKVMEMGFSREDALKGIDLSIENYYAEEKREELGLDKLSNDEDDFDELEFIIEYRARLKMENENVPDELANALIRGFQVEKEENEALLEEMDEKYLSNK